MSQLYPFLLLLQKIGIVSMARRIYCGLNRTDLSDEKIQRLQLDTIGCTAVREDNSK